MIRCHEYYEAALYSPPPLQNTIQDPAIGLQSVNVSSDVSGMSAIATIKALRPVSFKYKASSESKFSHFGFIAQEVETVLPQIVRSGDDGLKTIKTRDLIAVLTLGLQSLNRWTALLEQHVHDLDVRADSDRQILEPRIQDLEEVMLEEMV